MWTLSRFLLLRGCGGPHAVHGPVSWLLHSWPHLQYLLGSSWWLSGLHWRSNRLQVSANIHAFNKYCAAPGDYSGFTGGRVGFRYLLKYNFNKYSAAPGCLLELRWRPTRHEVHAQNLQIYYPSPGDYLGFTGGLVGFRYRLIYIFNMYLTAPGY